MTKGRPGNMDFHDFYMHARGGADPELVMLHDNSGRPLASVRKGGFFSEFREGPLSFGYGRFCS